MNDRELVKEWYGIETTLHEDFDIDVVHKAVSAIFKSRKKCKGKRPKLVVLDSPYQVMAYTMVKSAMGIRVMPAHHFTNYLGGGDLVLPLRIDDPRAALMGPIVRLILNQLRSVRGSRSFDPINVNRGKNPNKASGIGRRQSLSVLLPMFKRISNDAKLELFYKALQCPNPSGNAVEQFKRLVFITSVINVRSKELDLMFDFVKHTSEIKFLQNNEIVISRRPTKQLKLSKNSPVDGELWADGLTAHKPRELWDDIKYAFEPEKVTLDTLVDLNQEVQAAIMHMLDPETLLSQFGLVEEQKDEYGVLYKFPLDHDEHFNTSFKLKLVKVKNGTPEPDGSFKSYFLKVPGGLGTAHAAVAWTYNKTIDNYNPMKRT